MLKPDTWIKRLVAEKGMIEPFQETLVRGGCVSYGLSSYGYDLRLADEYHILEATDGEQPNLVADPKNLKETHFAKYRGESFLVPAKSFVLARSYEYFRIPRNVMAIVQGKSTYARCGLIVNVTPLEAGWEGFITMSLGNLSPYPIKIHAAEGIAQVLFFECDVCETSYADRAGKYQGQKGITPPKV